MFLYVLIHVLLYNFLILVLFRNDKEVQDILSTLTESAKISDRSTSAGNDPMNLMSLSIQASQARCTLGEISNALEDVWGRHVPTTTVVRGAYSATFTSQSQSKTEYDNLLKQVKQFEDDFGRRPRILVAKMGQASNFLFFIL